jgi:hypothetical protein
MLSLASEHEAGRHESYEAYLNAIGSHAIRLLDRHVLFETHKPADNRR